MIDQYTDGNHASEQLTEQYRQETEPRLRSWITESLIFKKKIFELQLAELLSVAETSGLKELSQKLDDFQPVKDAPAEHTDLGTILADIPDIVIVPQSEEHFAADRTDPVVVRFQKGFKRAERTFSKALTGTGNVFLGLLKKQKKTWAYPEREIPLRNLVHLGCIELLNELEGFDHLLLRHHAGILEGTFRWYMDSGTDETDEKPDLPSLIRSMSDKYDKDFTIAKERVLTVLQSSGALISDMIRQAGTVELRNNRLSDEAVRSKKDSVLKKAAQTGARWNRCLDVLTARNRGLQHAIDLVDQVSDRERQVLKQIQSFFSDFQTSSQATLAELLDNALESLTKASASPNKVLKKESEAIAESITSHVRDKALQILRTAESEYILSKSVNSYAEDLLRITNHQPEKIVLSEHTDLNSEPPSFEEVEIEWQRVTHIMLADAIASKLLADGFHPEKDLKDIIGAFDEIAQITETNLQLADEITRKDDQNPAEIALEGINRAVLKFNEASELTAQAHQSLVSEIADKSQAFFIELRNFLNKDDFGNVTWVQTQLRVKESAGDWKVKWTVAVANFLSRIEILQRFLIRKYRVWSEKIRVFLGNEQTAGIKTERINLATFLHETGQKFKELPFIYQRLFDFQRSIDTNLYVREPHHFEQVKKSFTLWQDGFPSSAIITGEVGSGKKTLISFLQDEILVGGRYTLTFSETIWREDAVLNMLSKALGIPPAATVEELIGNIRSKREGSVVIVENLHNCFIRAMSGYAGLRVLLSVIAETRKEIFWVVTCSKYSWNFLQMFMNIADHFSHAISTDQLTTDEIRNLIMKRQKASGYAYRFLPTPDTEHSRSFKKLLNDDAGQQQYLAAKYFEKLSSIADGNATVAIIYWVRSIVNFSDHEVQLKALDTTGMELIGSLEPTILFAISSFLLHGSLSTEELSISLNTSLAETEMIISRLNTNGLLVEKKGNYSLNLLIYRQVVRVLKSKNMLH